MNYLITADERLNRTNYEDWYPTVRSIMKAKFGNTLKKI